MESEAGHINNSVHDYFGEGRFSPLLLGIQTPLFVIGLVGAILNISLIYVTLRGKQASNNISFNRLLAALCVSDCTYELSQFLPMYLTLSGRNFIPLRTCFWTQSHAMMGAFASTALLFSIAFDRMLGVLIPLRRFNTLPYELVLVAAPVGYALAVWSLILNSYVRVKPELMVSCSLTDLFPDEVAPIIFGGCTFFNVSSVLCYLVIWLKLKTTSKKNMNNDTNNNREATRRIFKSLVAIMAVILVGWVVNAVLHIVIPPTGLLSPVQEFALFTMSGCLCVAGSGAHLPILYVLSTDYRERIRDGILSHFCKQQPSVGLVTGLKSQSLNHTINLKVMKSVNNP